MSSDSVPLISLEESTSFIDVKHSLVASTNSIEGTEFLSTKTKSLTTSPSFVHFIHNINQSNYFQDYFYFILFLLYVLIQDHGTTNTGSWYNQYRIMVQSMDQMYQPNEFKLK